MAKTTSSTRTRPAGQEEPPATEAAEEPAAEPATPGQPEEASHAPQDAASDEDAAGLPPGVYKYVHGIGCVYPHVPLTCHAYHPPVAATETTPEIPERKATVFEWLDGPPADGRWRATDAKPNQAADNAGGCLISKE